MDQTMADSLFRSRCTAPFASLLCVDVEVRYQWSLYPVLDLVAAKLHVLKQRNTKTIRAAFSRRNQAAAV